MGEKAIDLLVEGQSGHCVGMIDGAIKSMPIDEALNKMGTNKKHLYRLFNRLV